MSLPFYNWSRTAASNATADSTVNWAEGMAPSAVNDSARAMMASTAAFRDDIAGAIATGGSSTAYTVSSFQVFDSLSHLNGQMIAFTPHTTNGATVTLNVDGLGAKPLRAQPSVDLQSGVLIQGTPYAALYNNADAAFYLFGVGANPGIPVGALLPFVGFSAPNSSFVLPFGQAVSRTTYASLFSICSTFFGAGDGSTTFNLPDLRGRVVAGGDAMGGSAAGRLTTAGGGVDGATMGASGGNQNKTLAANDLPANIPNTLGATFSPASGSGTITVGTGTGTVVSGGTVNVPILPTSVTLGGTVSITGAINGSSTNTPVKLIPPTIVCNYILRVI